jgi:DNA-directed RNA polymerase specialized sigma subunit
MVIELLLEGKSQAVISHALDVCEGTVSRLRTRAIASLRSLMAE